MENFDIIKFVVIALSLIIAIVGHEIMHGLVAFKYGDNTAKNQNRLSINPIRHIDPIGTIILPAVLYATNAGFMFGWAKPVPVNMNVVIKNGGYNGAIGVALAGIAYNITLALTCSLILNNIGSFLTNSTLSASLVIFLYQMISTNIVLAIFNLLPLPPLDGFKALGFSLAKFGQTRLASKLFYYERYGMIFLVLIVATPVGDYLFYPMRLVIKTLLP